MIYKTKVSKFDYFSCVNKKYSEHLTEILKQPFYECFKKMCDEIESKTQKLKILQKTMKEIKHWEYERIKKEAKFVLVKANVKYISKLIDATILSGIKLLTVTASRKNVKIESEIPDIAEFFHKCFIEIGKNFYLEPYLLCDEKEKSGTRLKNITDSMYLIEKSIGKTINYFLPYDNILEVYLKNIEEESSSDDEESEQTGGYNTENEETDDDVNEEDHEETDDDVNKNDEDFVNNKEDDIKKDETITITETDMNHMNDTKLDDNDEVLFDAETENLPDGLNVLPTTVTEKPKEQSQEKPTEIKSISVQQNGGGGQMIQQIQKQPQIQQEVQQVVYQQPIKPVSIQQVQTSQPIVQVAGNNNVDNKQVTKKIVFFNDAEEIY